MGFDRYPYMKHSTAEPQKQDVTLADYIKRKQENAVQKNLTFQEWWKTAYMKPAFLHIGDREAEMIWNAAQGNK